MSIPEKNASPGFINHPDISAIFWVAVTIIASSVEPIAVKTGYKASATPLQFVVIKALVGGILIVPLTRTFKWIGLKGVSKFLFVSLLYTLTTALVLIALNYISAVMVITIITTTPALVALINQAKGRDKLKLKFWIGFMIALIGIFLTFDISKVSLDISSCTLNFTGFFCVFASVATSAIYRTNLDDLTREYTPFGSSNYIFILNAIIVLMFIAPFTGPIDKSVWALGILIGFTGAIANIGFLAAIHLLGSTKISMLGVLQRPVVIIAVALILKESLNLIQIAGIILVIAGIQMATMKTIKIADDKR